MQQAAPLEGKEKSTAVVVGAGGGGGGGGLSRQTGINFPRSPVPLQTVDTPRYQQQTLFYIHLHLQRERRVRRGVGGGGGRRRLSAISDFSLFLSASLPQTFSLMAPPLCLASPLRTPSHFFPATSSLALSLSLTRSLALSLSPPFPFSPASRSL